MHFRHVGKSVIVVFLLMISGLAMPPASAEGVKTLDALMREYDSRSCKKCHEKIYSQWQRSHHARSLMGGGGIFMRSILKRGVFSLEDPKQAEKRSFPCFKCHLPQAVNAPEPVLREIATAILAGDTEIIGRLNIGCIVCHRDMALIHRLQDGEPEEDVLYGTADIAEHDDKRFPTVKRSPVMKRSIMCGRCHGLGPNFEFDNPVQCATLYGSYLHAYIADGGTKTCRECHMKEGDHSAPPDFGPDRKRETSAYLAASIRLDVETIAYEFLGLNRSSPDPAQRTGFGYMPRIVVKTEISTTAGHRVPDG